LVRDWLSDRPPRLDITTKARGLRCKAVAIGSDNIDQGVKTPVAVGLEFLHHCGVKEIRRLRRLHRNNLGKAARIICVLTHSPPIA